MTTTNTSANINKYYYVNGQKMELVIEPTAYAVKFAANARSSIESLPDNVGEFLSQDSHRTEVVTPYDLQIYEINSSQSRGSADHNQLTESVFNEVEKLNQQDSIDYASLAYRQSARNPDLMFVTNRFLVQFKPTVTPEAIQELNQRYHAKMIEPLDYAENGYILEAPSGEGEFSAIALANRYYETGLAIFSQPDFVRKHYTKSVALEQSNNQLEERSNYLPEQWHLASTHVIDAWSLTYGSENITVAILDDGVDLSHPEFSGKVTQQFDFASNTADGTPKTSEENHGTACAGVAVAAGIKAYGAAPNCSLMAVRRQIYLDIADEARMFKWAADNGADIISCSWGPKDGEGSVDPLPDPTRAAIRYCVERGRNGKGIPIFWAAGNGNELVSLDGYASNPDVMAIAACTSNDTRSPYSDFGPEIFLTAPSSGSREQGDKDIFTTDRRGSYGYNEGDANAGDADGDYTNSFNGTSSSTPLVAGIAALLLSVNPNLTVQQVRDCLQRTATKIGEGYDGSGHSPEFGFGRVNALEAVCEAQRLIDATPTIEAPAEVVRWGIAPMFVVNPSPNRYYAVEVATRAELFDWANHGSERTTSNFYASWQHTALFSEPTYDLPTPVWEQLKSSDRLFYRLLTSASNTDWVNYTVTTPDDQSASAPSLEIL